MQKTLKVKLMPLTKTDLKKLQKLKETYTTILKEALGIVIGNDVRTRKQAHDLCYDVLRQKYPKLHNKFVQEAYKRALSMYKSYLKLRKRYERGLLKSGPSLPKVNGNDVIDLHIDTFRLIRVNETLVLSVTIGKAEYARFIVLEYDYFTKHLENWKIQNSRIVVDKEIYLHLTLSRSVNPKHRENKLVIDINEETIDCLLVTKDEAILFKIKHDIKKIRTNYRRIRRNIQKNVKNERKRNGLLAKYGEREKNRVNDRIKKISSLITDLCVEFNADLVVENLKYLKNSKRRNKELNYRLQTLPYRRLLSNLEHKANEKEINVIKVNPHSSSTTCPLCGFKSKKNRLNVSTFRCVKCGFEFDAQFVACLNLLSRADDSRLAIRHGRFFIHKAGFVVPVDVAPDVPLMRMKWLREKPVLIVSKISVV
jgi:putative transposase